MKFDAASVADLRHQMEVAQTLAKSHISFVVIPVATRSGFELLCRHQADRLEALAQIAEEERAKP